MSGKRINLDSKFQPNKCVKRRHGDDDRISRLPDDILVVILSSLPLKEAALTSVLSSRWRDLWKHTSCLNFDADSALDKIAKQNDLRKQEEWQNVEMRKYVKWVNGVLQSHKALTLKEFRICFNLDRSSRKAITKWLEFAFSRQVQRLELEALYNGHSRGCESKNYVFPEELLRQNYVHPLRASDNSGIRYMQAHFDFKSIKALSLKGVKVAGEALEFFLRNCPLLEQLVVHCSEKVSNLEVCGSSLSLKHLEIVHCCDVKSIKVSAPNLSSLTVPLLKKGLVLENVPSLVEVSATCGAWNTSFKKFVPAFSCCLSRLEILTLFICDPKEITEVQDFPELPKLKKLEIQYFARGDQSLLGLTSLIRASPYLQEFVVKSIWSELSRANREIKIDIQFSHQHLTVFKFLGYYGRASDIELVRYISENCLVLEKIVIDPHYCQPGFTRGPIYYYQKKERTAIIYAKQLLQAEVVPRHIELVIL